MTFAQGQAAGKGAIGAQHASGSVFGATDAAQGAGFVLAAQIHDITVTTSLAIVERALKPVQFHTATHQGRAGVSTEHEN
ncbi:MAG TPA: hypothetical protein ENJ19_00460 [Gammaproteobacteria bacterium]|nr:hypothetical protein [Gammaproteobacteria bacterium]